MKNKLTCLHICNDFSGSKVHSNLYQSLDNLDIRQIIYHPTRSNTPVGNNIINFETEESKIYNSKPTKKYHRILYKAKINFLFKDLVNKISLENINIIHATTLFSDGGVALQIKKKYNIPYIVAVRSTDVNTFFKFRKDLKKDVIEILEESSKIIFISDSLFDKFKKHSFIKKEFTRFSKKCEIIYNGVDHFWLDNIHEKKINPQKRILYIGSLTKRKNIVNLSKAVINLNSNGGNYKLTIVGDGDKSLLISNPAINYLGKINDKNELRKVYSDNYIFALPSSNETFGLVYIEALSQGLPILIIKKEGIDGAFKFKIGERCHNSSIEEISNNLKLFIENYDKYQLEKIKFSIFDWSNIALKYQKIYKSSIY